MVEHSPKNRRKWGKGHHHHHFGEVSNEHGNNDKLLTYTLHATHKLEFQLCCDEGIANITLKQFISLKTDTEEGNKKQSAATD